MALTETIRSSCRAKWAKRLREVFGVNKQQGSADSSPFASCRLPSAGCRYCGVPVARFRSPSNTPARATAAERRRTHAPCRARSSAPSPGDVRVPGVRTYDGGVHAVIRSHTRRSAPIPAETLRRQVNELLHDINLLASRRRRHAFSSSWGRGPPLPTKSAAAARRWQASTCGGSRMQWIWPGSERRESLLGHHDFRVQRRMAR